MDALTKSLENGDVLRGVKVGVAGFLFDNVAALCAATFWHACLTSA